MITVRRLYGSREKREEHLHLVAVLLDVPDVVEDHRVHLVERRELAFETQHSAINAVLGPRSILRHAWLERNRGVAEMTHIILGKKCFFDHLLVSRDHFEVVDAGFHRDWRKKKRDAAERSLGGGAATCCSFFCFLLLRSCYGRFSSQLLSRSADDRALVARAAALCARLSEQRSSFQVAHSPETLG
jgi:hypothetical protein